VVASSIPGQTLIGAGQQLLGMARIRLASRPCVYAALLLVAIAFTAMVDGPAFANDPPFSLSRPIPEALPGAGCVKSTFKVALDIGHDRSHPGATSARGVSEYDYNLALGRLVLQTLRVAGFTSAFLIDEAGDSIQLARRPDIARQAHAAVFISLHHDSVQPRYLSQWMVGGHVRPYSDTFHGYSIFVSSTSRWAAANLALAIGVGGALASQGLVPSLHHAIPVQGENRRLLNRDLGIYAFDELAVLRGATMPALLLESGIIVNRDEEQAIQSGTHETKVALGILSGVTQFCEMKR
jgi:N-acetylmuramoyl-L-alanine amidase